MLEILIRDFKRIRRADLMVSGLCLVCAPNEAGKSSLSQAVRAALTGNALPLDGEGQRLTKKDSAPKLVRNGAETASVTLIEGDSSAAMTWPRCEFATQGANPPQASRVAAGLDSFAHMDAKDRAKYLVQLLDALPSRDDLGKAIAAAGIERAELATKAVWEIIEKDGWDLAYNRAREKGSKLKGQWEESAGESYGADKAKDWRPQGWDPRFDDLTPEEAQAGVEAIHKELQEFDEAAGAKAGMYDHIRREAARHDELMKKPERDLPGLKKKLDEARAARAALPPSNTLGDIVHCIACGHEQVAARQGLGVKLIEKVDLTHDEKLARQAAINEADKLVEKADREYRDAYAFNEDLGKQRESAAKAKAKLPTLPQGSGQYDATARQEIIDRSYRASWNAGLVQKRHRCALLQRQIVDSQNLIQLLAPTGLRQKAAAKALAAFNETLARLSGTMGINAVQVLDDMSVVQVSEEGSATPYTPLLMSASQMFRCRIVLQVACALSDRSGMVSIDTDVDQDRKWLAGTLKMLASAGLPAVVTLRADRPEEAPARLPPKVDGSIWFIRDGVVVPIAEALPQRQAAE